MRDDHTVLCCTYSEEGQTLDELLTELFRSFLRRQLGPVGGGRANA